MISTEEKMNAVRNFLISNELTSDENIRLVTRIYGDTLKTLLDILQVCTGHRDIECAAQHPEMWKFF